MDRTRAPDHTRRNSSKNEPLLQPQFSSVLVIYGILPFLFMSLFLSIPLDVDFISNISEIMSLFVMTSNRLRKYKTIPKKKIGLRTLRTQNLLIQVQNLGRNRADAGRKHARRLSAGGELPCPGLVQGRRCGESGGTP